MDMQAFGRERLNKPVDFLQQWAAVHIILQPKHIYRHLISKLELSPHRCTVCLREPVNWHFTALSVQTHTIYEVKIWLLHTHFLPGSTACPSNHHCIKVDTQICIPRLIADQIWNMVIISPSVPDWMSVIWINSEYYNITRKYRAIS